MGAICLSHSSTAAITAGDVAVWCVLAAPPSSLGWRDMETGLRGSARTATPLS